MYCGYCGSQLEESAKFCHKCGKKVEMEIECRTNSIKESRKENQTSVLIVTIITLAFTVLIIIIAYMQNMPQTRVCDWCGKSSRGDFYYDPYDPDSIMCENCARQYFMGLPFEDYKVR